MFEVIGVDRNAKMVIFGHTDGNYMDKTDLRATVDHGIKKALTGNVGYL